jgi:hypothetical protein
LERKEMSRYGQSHRVGTRLRAAQRGQALLTMLCILGLAAALLVYGSTTEISRSVHADERTRDALEEARQALIGRAVSDANRPGSLPCPDADGDGSADLFVGSSCPAYVGRLPWRSLGVGDLRDESGERLWYALSPSFRDHPSAPAINSDSRGTLTVYSADETAPVTTEAVAVVFAPGAALNGQVRDGVTQTCSSNGRIVPRANCPVNYLDAINKFSNANASGPFVAPPLQPGFNDKLAVVTTSAFMPLVERRVALEARNALLDYKRTSACRCFPWPDETGDGVSDAGVNRGRIPVKTALPQAWPAGLLPSYFSANDWARVTHYVVARSALEQAGQGCTTCAEANLTIDSLRGYEVVLLTPGFATGSRQRSSLSDYFADPENANGNDRFVTPRSPDAERNNIYGVAGAGVGCAAVAGVLIDNAPCAEPGGGIRGACQAALASASGCSCASAAGALATGACASAPGSAACAAVIAQLGKCTS